MRTGGEIVSCSPSPESGEVILISGHIGESHDDLLPRHQVRDCLEPGDWAQRNFGKQRQCWQLGLPRQLASYRKCCFYQFSAFTQKHSMAFLKNNSFICQNDSNLLTVTKIKLLQFFLFAFAFYLWQSSKWSSESWQLPRLDIVKLYYLRLKTFTGSDWSKVILQDKLLANSCFLLLNPDHDHDRPLDWA